MSYFNQLLNFPPEVSDLPQDINQIIQMMAEKQASLTQWENLSYVLFKEKRQQDFLSLISYITEYVLNKFHDDASKQIKIRIYNSLSIYFLIEATKQDGFDKASEYFENVVKNFNLSDKYDFVGHTFSIKGLYSFYRGEKDQTLNYYKTSIDDTSQFHQLSLSVTPCIGIAQVYFSTGNYKEALQYFKKAIKLKPNIAGRARLGLAYCFYNLGNYSMAYYAFKRCLQLEPNNVDAHIGLGVLHYDKGEYSEYFNLICNAYKLDPEHPVVMYHLAEHYLYKQNYERVQKCIKVGLRNLEGVSRFQFKEKTQEDEFRNDWNQLKSRYLYIFGLLKHIENDFDAAFKYYNQAKNLNRNNMLVLFGLSQIYLHTQSLNYNESYKLSERVCKQYENTPFIHELHKPFAYIQFKNIQNKKIVADTYKKALQYNSMDSEILIEYAQQLENEDASSYYANAESILISKSNNQTNFLIFQKPYQSMIFPELYINMGVHYATINLNLAMDSYNKCFVLLQDFQIPEFGPESSEESQKQEIHLKKNVYSVVLAYDKGILLELMGDYITAIEQYKLAISINPYFIDGYVRLAFLQHELGDSQDGIRTIQDAKIYLEQILQHNKNYRMMNPIPPIYAYISYQLYDEPTAKEQFKQLPEDCYSKIFLMAHDYQMAADKNKVNDSSFLKSVLRQIAQTANKILTHDTKNVQAALILVLVIAELGKYNEALIQLDNLQEYANFQPRIYSNLGILQSMMEEEDNYQAAKLYFKKFNEKTNYHPDDHTEVAIAQMHLNFHNYRESANAIKRQILNNPGQMKHRLNLNMIIHSQCYQVLEDQTASYTLLSQAVTYFKCLLRSYEYMSKSTCWYWREQQYLPHLRQSIRSNQIQILRDKSDDKYSYISSFQANFEKLLKEAEDKERQLKIIQEEKEKERRQRLFLAQQQLVTEEAQMDEDKLREMSILMNQHLEAIKKEAELLKLTEATKGKGKVSKSEKKKRHKEQIQQKEQLEEDQKWLESDEEDQSYNSQQAEKDELNVKEEIGDNSEELFQEQEQYEQKLKQKKNIKKKDKKKQKIKNRLQKHEDLSDVFESKELDQIDDAKIEDDDYELFE